MAVEPVLGKVPVRTVPGCAGISLTCPAPCQHVLTVLRPEHLDRWRTESNLILNATSRFGPASDCPSTMLAVEAARSSGHGVNSKNTRVSRGALDPIPTAMLPANADSGRSNAGASHT